MGQGRENARAYLEQHPDLVAQIEQQVRAQMSPAAVVAASASDTDEATESLD